MSRFSLVHPPSARVRSIKQIGATNYWVSNEGLQLRVQEGFQGVQNSTFIGLQDLKQLCTYVQPTAGLQPFRFVVESVSGEYVITNSSLATAYVDIYDVCRKRDSVNDGTLTPYIAWTNGLYWESNGTEAEGSVMINSLPTDSSQFREYFYVKKRTQIALRQGSTHRHQVSLKLNKLFDSLFISGSQGDIAGTSVYTMIVARGQPVSVVKEGSPLADVTTASLAIDVVKAQRIKYTWASDRTNNWTATDGLISTAAPQRIVSSGAGMFVDNDAE